NFANAIAISGFWGTTNVDISGATAEIGEPEIAGVRATRSVWYKFTPVLDGVVTVHTFGSAVDTRLSVFIVPANTNVAVNSSLFPVVANDDLSLTAGDPASPALAGPNGPEVTRGPSAVQFPAKMGVTYYVAVDGRAGQVQLTWGYNFGGLFYMPKAFVTNPYNPVFVEAAKTEGTIQFSVSRAFGYSGQVQVTVVTTNLPEIYYQATNAAIPGTDPTTDYTAATNILTFDDFEMTKTFRVRIREARYVPPPPVDPPDTNAPPIAPFYANRYFGVKIVDVRFSSQENTNLLEPPTIMSGNEISVGRMLDVNIPYGTGDDPSGNVPAFTNNVINFAVKHQTTTEYLPGDGDGFVHIVLTRNGTGDPSQGCSIGWAINSLISWGDLMNNQFDVWPESDYATPTPPTTAPPGAGSADFGLPSIGTVSWGGYDFIPKEVLIPIYDDDMVEFNEDFYIEMIPESATSCVMGEVNSSVVTILFDGNDQPAGALEGGYNAHNEPPNNPFPGANAAIFALAVQPADQSVVIGGAFTSYNAFLRNRIARVNYDGSIDQNFTVGTGADGLVTSLALQPDGKIVMGGDFRAVNGDNRYRVARLMASGTVDATFNPGLGADDTVWSLALSTNGSVVIGGQFNTFNNYTLNHVARLSSSGDVDLSFDTSNLGLDGTVWAVAPQEDGKVVIGGDFTMVNGFQRSRIARLNADGSVDTTFDPGLGANDTIYTLLVQPDRNILVGGAFSQFHIASHRGLTRLLSTGALDPTFNPGSSANDVVYSLFLPPDSSRIYVGGMFTEFNSTRRVGLARLYLNGTVDTGFMDTAYNQFAGIPNPVFNPDLYPHNTVFAIGLEQVAIPSGTNFVPAALIV
ncbi:MAG: hypothetical protein NT154_14530, partial [Verrucomicrobia bacterium]|nr:hypothetical protein [Verrucomicrobiota bacterium]